MIRIIWEKEYTFDSLCDIDRDVHEAINYNEIGIPNGDFRGTITIMIEYKDENTRPHNNS